ncbi:hypothetical protein I6N90_19870 [Paenibacillus sp. GSMTC-2017]|uniref:hypothetical protein n=1 Tax=Paenibacillus sp. GSMTC-2017 TaxID=2794350 RepID=UPI0018D64071|nr:hypothetical protein [Paenibacillus sp. GSMTC-2017]MBH5320064.1 hypothetical protein [Paenibacillus sp. GSMTC-2017]
MMLLPLIAIIGCGSEPKENKYDKASARILEALEEKYGEKFEMDKIGGAFGTVNSNTIKAIVRPKKDSRIMVEVEITKDLKDVYDKYLNETVARSNEQPIEELAKQIWPDARVALTNDTVWTYPTQSDTSMSYEEFVKLYPTNWQLVFVYINTSKYVDIKGELNEDAELKKYKQFKELLVNNKYIRSSVGIDYLSEDAYLRIDEILNTHAVPGIVFTKEEEVDTKVNYLTQVGFHILEQGELKETDEEIKEYFKIWSEKRNDYFDDKKREE